MKKDFWNETLPTLVGTVLSSAAVGAALWLCVTNFRALAYEKPEAEQMVVECYSGGHMIFEAQCEECDMYSGGYVQGVDTDGNKFQASGECTVLPVSYYEAMERQALKDLLDEMEADWAPRQQR